MSRYRLSPLAVADIDNILDETVRLFGTAQEERYFNLILAAVERVADDPFSIGTKARRSQRWPALISRRNGGHSAWSRSPCSLLPDNHFLRRRA
jgi:plasmid stabilization system protein ParE